MAILSFDDRGFLLRSQRITVMGARCEYSLLDRSSWRTCLLNLKQSGFNTVLASAPWSVHEVREGQYDFSDNRDLPEFLKQCSDLGLHVILRVGPNVGRPFSCGALPDWLPPQSQGANHREANPGFLSPLTNWWKQLFGEIRDFQHGDDQTGPLLAIQIEHDAARAWQLQEFWPVSNCAANCSMTSWGIAPSVPLAVSSASVARLSSLNGVI